MAINFFSVIVSTRLRYDLHAIKIYSSEILFHSSSISEPIFGWEVAFDLFSKTLHSVIKRSGLDGCHKETPVISEILFLVGFGVKKIMDSLSFLFLLTHIGPNFNEKELE